MPQQPNPRAVDPETPDLTNSVVEVDVGPVAHGGHCVARLGGERSRVVFVRHTLPGERVRVRITEDHGGSFCRGDAIEIVRAAPGRVEPPCAYAGPGACGGCDWQHVDPAVQRAFKASVVAEQLQRLAGIDWDVTVEELPGGPLGWRTDVRYAADAAGRLGLHRHRSRDVEVLDRCLIGAPGVGDAPELADQWPGSDGIEVISAGPDRAVLVGRPAAVDRRRHRPPRQRSAKPPRPRTVVTQLSGPGTLEHTVGGHRFISAPRTFWQGHPAAAGAYTDAVLAALAPAPGETGLDLYGGAGLFAVALADAVGPTGRVDLVEGDQRAAQDAATNLAAQPWAHVHHAPVTPDTVTARGPVDVVVLDPPRVGAGRAVMEAILASGARAVAYVACDPAAFARDVATARTAGWQLTDLRAFDAFPMTHHVECVGRLEPGDILGRP